MLYSTATNLSKLPHLSLSTFPASSDFKQLLIFVVSDCLFPWFVCQQNFILTYKRDFWAQTPCQSQSEKKVISVTLFLSNKKAAVSFCTKNSRLKLSYRGLLYEIYDGSGGIRTHVPLRTTAFRVRLVMTTSIRFHRKTQRYNYTR